jgi:2-oxoisovalerate dehydrogenase E1 component
MSSQTAERIAGPVSAAVLEKAYRLMCTAKEMTVLYEEKSAVTAKYVHATSRGHEAIQLAVSLQLKAQDYLSAYYRDDSMMLGIGMKPYELMLQLMAKRDDPFSGGRTYYCHPSLKREGMPSYSDNRRCYGSAVYAKTRIVKYW